MTMPCPHCGFLVTPDVSPHGSPQRCPSCDGSLPDDPSAATSPLENPIDEADEAGAGTASGLDESGSANTEASDDLAVDAPIDASDSNPGQTDGATLDAAPPATTPPAARSATVTGTRTGRTRRPVPSFVRGSAVATTRRRAWPWYAAIAMLSALLGLQLLLAQRDELAADARWRPWVARLCSALPCEIPPWREPRAYTMLDRSVQPDSTLPGVLSVEASFRNDARWPQPWPTLLLTLSDIDGRDVGMRAFAPSEYREGPHGPGDLLAPGQSATARLQVREPAPRIVAFTFDFQ